MFCQPEALISSLLAVGIDPSSNLEQLLEMGIRQFFAGYVPTDWLELYGSQVSPNRRYRLREQFTRKDQIARAAERLQQAGASLSFVLNAPFITPSLEPQLRQQIRFLLDLPHSSIIAGSPATALMLLELGCDSIVLSNLFGCYSVESVAWCLETFHPDKIILPRDLLPDELAGIANAFPQTSFEAFLCGDTCRFSEPYCFVEHGFDSVISRDLCRYARQECRPHTRAPLRFREIARQHGIDTLTAASHLSISMLDSESLLDEICCNAATGRADQLGTSLDRLAQFDLAGWLKERPALYHRAVVILRSLDHPVAVKLCQRLDAALPDISTMQCDYNAFHGLDSATLRATMQLYRRIPNITSWKLPARGRNLPALLAALEATFADTSDGGTA